MVIMRRRLVCSGGSPTMKAGGRFEIAKPIAGVLVNAQRKLTIITTDAMFPIGPLKLRNGMLITMPMSGQPIISKRERQPIGRSLHIGVAVMTRNPHSGHLAGSAAVMGYRQLVHFAWIAGAGGVGVAGSMLRRSVGA